MRDDMRICGSCHTLVVISQSDIVDCPRCSSPLDPGPEDILKKFIASGIVEFNRKGGVTLQEAQKAATQILEELDHVRGVVELHDREW